MLENRSIHFFSKYESELRTIRYKGSIPESIGNSGLGTQEEIWLKFV